MDKLNEELIFSHKRLKEIEEEKKSLEEEYSLLQDKIHYYFDSKVDTKETEKYIISQFWSQAYDKYKDGGYITNDEYTVKVRFDYECKLITRILEENQPKFSRALDIGCGNGRYTKELSKSFDEVVGIDLSETRISLNNIENKNNSITYMNKNFMDVEAKDLGKFDFVFVGDIFMYSHEEDVNLVFNNLMNLLEDNGVLLIRESTRIIGNEDYKSKNYVAYYRNFDFYTQGVFKDTFKKRYRNYAYNLYHLEKYFNLHKDEKENIFSNSLLLEDIVESSVNIYLKSSHFYIYKKR